MAEDLATQEAVADVPEEGKEVTQDALPRDVVSAIVERERKKAFEKGRQEALMQQQQSLNTEAQQEPQAQQAPSIGGMPQMSQADIERLIQERAPQLFQEQLQQQISEHQRKQMVESFVSKMQAAEAKYPGLEKKLNELDYSTLTPVIEMANAMENTGDIMKELVDYPEKMSNLILLSYTQPSLARVKMQDLSTSIRTNQEALAQEKEANEPLSQMKPSNSVTKDDSALTVADFRKMFR